VAREARHNWALPGIVGRFVRQAGTPLKK